MATSPLVAVQEYQTGTPQSTEGNAAMRTTDRHDREDALRTFYAIARDTIANGGGTFRRETGAPVTLTTGYTVGVGTVAAFGCSKGYRNLDIITDALAREWPKTAPANAQYVGTWIDEDASLLFIDHVTVISDLHIALALAERNAEYAIFDNANGVCIDVADALAPVFVADAPAGTVWWRDGVAHCPHCDASLEHFGTVTYRETYDACIGQTSFGVAVEYESYTIESDVHCAACGGELDYEAVTAA